MLSSPVGFMDRVMQYIGSGNGISVGLWVASINRTTRNESSSAALSTLLKNQPRESALQIDPARMSDVEVNDHANF